MVNLASNDNDIKMTIILIYWLIFLSLSVKLMINKLSCIDQLGRVGK